MKNNSNVLIGLACGDALGQPFETMRWNSPEVLAWDGHSFLSSTFHKIGPGATTDDTAMAICLTESLLTCKKFDPADVANNYLKWYMGDIFVGAGQTTRKALDNLKNGAAWYESGVLGSLGNAPAMRAAPLGVWFKDDPIKLTRAAKLDAIITHDSNEAMQGSITVAMTISLLLNGTKKEDLLKIITGYLEPSRVLDNINLITSNTLIAKTLKNKDYDKERDRNGGNRIISQLILGNKYTVIDVVARSLYVFLATNSFEEALELAIRAGGDSDTCGAIVGSFCGAYYDELPKSYVDRIENKDYILELDKKLFTRD